MKFFLLVIVFLFSLSCSSQNNTPKQLYEQFQNQVKSDFNDFRAQVNERYAAFLKHAWSQFSILPAIPHPRDKELPPIVAPIKEQENVIGHKPIPIKDIITPPMPTPQPKPINPIKEQNQPRESNVCISFYGIPCKIRINKSAHFSLSSCDNDDLAITWNKLSQDGLMNNTIRDCLAVRLDKQLCDWAYLNLLAAFSKQVYGENNEAVLFMAYIYCQSGYKMRLGKSNGQLYILFASEHTIYDKPYFKVGNTKFYPFCGGNIKQLEICEAYYPQEKPLSLWISQNQQFAYAPTEKRSLISKRYPDVQLQVQVNKNKIDFYDTYPSSEVDDNFMTRWAIYANTPMDEQVKATFYPCLKDIIGGLSQLEAANKLLNWVQTAFLYEYDDKVWGHDRAFFAEETLYYPYCDCEDRSILFTRVVRDLLKLETVLVYYPGHLACAVRFTENVRGDYIELKGKRFVITDPTYIGAPVGLTMPDMNNAKASVIILE